MLKKQQLSDYEVFPHLIAVNRGLIDPFRGITAHSAQQHDLLSFNWRASVASETVLGVDNAKSGICYIYVCMYGWYVCSLNARG